VELAALGLEDRLLARLADVILELGLREVVHLLDPCRMDAAVFDQLLERRARDLAAEPVERGEDDRLRGVVDDEVDPGQVLERPDVAALAADDPPLHVVGRKLDDRDRRLGRMAGGDSLERIGDQRACAPAGLRPRFLLLLAHAARELVADQILRALEQVALRLSHRQAPDSLELAERFVLRRLQLLLELLDVHLAVVQPLLATLDLRLLAHELVLGGRNLLLDPGGLRAPALDLALDLRTQLHRQLASLDLSLAPDRLGLPLGHVHARPAAEHQQPRRHGSADRQSNQRHNRSEHAVLPPEGEGGFRDERRGAHIRRRACTAAFRSWRVRSRSSRRVLPGVRWIEG
jgi:hypothetical protein